MTPASAHHSYRLTGVEAELAISAEVAIGDDLRITLSEIPSTGYCWELRSLPEGVALVLDTIYYVPDNDDPELVGGGGELVISFRVCDKVNGDIVLIKRRSWEQDVIQTATVTLNSAH